MSKKDWSDSGQLKLKVAISKISWMWFIKDRMYAWR